MRRKDRCYFLFAVYSSFFHSLGIVVKEQCVQSILWVHHYMHRRRKQQRLNLILSLLLWFFSVCRLVYVRIVISMQKRRKRSDFFVGVMQFVHINFMCIIINFFFLLHVCEFLAFFEVGVTLRVHQSKEVDDKYFTCTKILQKAQSTLFFHANTQKLCV